MQSLRLVIAVFVAALSLVEFSTPSAQVLVSGIVLGVAAVGMVTTLRRVVRRPRSGVLVLASGLSFVALIIASYEILLATQWRRTPAIRAQAPTSGINIVARGSADAKS